MFSAISAFFQNLSDISELPLDQTKAAFCLIMSYFLGIGFSYLKGASLRLYAGLALGLIIQVLVYEYEMILPIVLTAIVYLQAKYLRENCVKPITISVFAFTSCYHIYRMYIDWGSYKIDASFILMMSVCKYTSFAWSYRDSFAPENILSPEQKYRKIAQFPSVSEFYGYIFFFPSSILGPFFEFKDYILFIRLQDRYAACVKGIKIGALMLTFGLLSSVGFSLFTPYFNVEYLLSHDYSQQNILFKIVYLFIIGFVVRLKFYTGFYLAQSSMDSCGLSYSGNVDGKETFNTVIACGRYAEFIHNAKEGIENWNSSVQTWLKRYVYERMIDRDVSRGRNPNVSMATRTTFAVSAFWHGFYPSYYTTFFIFWCQIEFGRKFFRAKPRLHLPSFVYKFLDYFISVLGFGYAVINHWMNDWGKSLKMYQNTNFICIILPLGLAYGLQLTGLARSSKNKEPKRVEKEHAKAD